MLDASLCPVSFGEHRNCDSWDSAWKPVVFYLLSGQDLMSKSTTFLGLVSWTCTDVSRFCQTFIHIYSLRTSAWLCLYKVQASQTWSVYTQPQFSSPAIFYTQPQFSSPAVFFPVCPPALQPRSHLWPTFLPSHHLSLCRSIISSFDFSFNYTFISKREKAVWINSFLSPAQETQTPARQQVRRSTKALKQPHFLRIWTL